jgi:hypothetical protein
MTPTRTVASGGAHQRAGPPRGSATVNSAPPPSANGRLRTVTPPPCSPTSVRTIAKPRPVPPAPARRGGALDEALEDRVDLVGRDAGAAVAHTEPQHRRIRLRPHLDDAPRGGEAAAFARRFCRTWASRCGSALRVAGGSGCTTATRTPRASTAGRAASTVRASQGPTSRSIGSRASRPASASDRRRRSSMRRPIRSVWLRRSATSAAVEGHQAVGQRLEPQLQRRHRRAQFVRDVGDHRLPLALRSARATAAIALKPSLRARVSSGWSAWRGSATRTPKRPAASSVVAAETAAIGPRDAAREGDREGRRRPPGLKQRSAIPIASRRAARESLTKAKSRSTSERRVSASHPRRAGGRGAHRSAPAVEPPTGDEAGPGPPSPRARGTPAGSAARAARSAIATATGTASSATSATASSASSRRVASRFTEGAVEQVAAPPHRADEVLAGPRAAQLAPEVDHVDVDRALQAVAVGEGGVVQLRRAR